MTKRMPLATKWEAFASTPFPMLVRLSMNRIFHGSNAGEEELNISMGLLLGVLAIPGGFASVLLFDKYGSFLQWLRGQAKFDPLAAAMPDEYFFIVLSMVVTGGVALWWWNSIFPDRRDFVNLVPLPITTSRIFLANSVAIVILTCLCVIDVNAASSVLFPASVGGAQPSFRFVIQFAGVHALVVILASVFSFLAVFASAGLLMLLLPYTVFRRISLYVRTLMAILLLVALSTSFTVPRMISDLPRSSQSLLRFLPPAWFLGFCQVLRGRADPSLADLAHIAIFALLATAVLAVVAYAVSYHRCFVRLLELADTPPGRLGVHTSWIFCLLDRLVLHTPFQRAGYRFVMKTLFRNEAHALATGGFVGLGVVVASRTLFSAFNSKGITPLPSADVLSIPLILSYCLLVGIRLVFDVPAHLQANWMFRLALDRGVDESAALARRVILCFAVPCIVLVAFPIYLHYWGWTVALVHASVVMAWLVLLTEVLLVGFRKLPFTCTYPLFEHSAVAVAMAYVFGYFAFTAITSELELESFSRPVMGMVFLVISLGLWYTVHRVRRLFVEVDEHLIFEDKPAVSFQLLHLSGRPE
jgi:hypothetical protein